MSIDCFFGGKVSVLTFFDTDEFFLHLEYFHFNETFLFFCLSVKKNRNQLPQLDWAGVPPLYSRASSAAACTATLAVHILLF